MYIEKAGQKLGTSKWERISHPRNPETRALDMQISEELDILPKRSSKHVCTFRKSMIHGSGDGFGGVSNALLLYRLMIFLSTESLSEKHISWCRNTEPRTAIPLGLHYLANSFLFAVSAVSHRSKHA